MKSYRIYTLNERGRIAHAQVVEAQDDREVVSEIANFENPYGIEIWSAKRLVGLIEAVSGRFLEGVSAAG